MAAGDRIVAEYTTSYSSGNRICFGLGACSAGCTGVVSTTNNGSSWSQNSSYAMPMQITAGTTNEALLLPPQVAYI